MYRKNLRTLRHVIYRKSLQRAPEAERGVRGYKLYRLRKNTSVIRIGKRSDGNMAVIKVEPRVIVLKSIDLGAFLLQSVGIGVELIMKLNNSYIQILR